MKKLLIIVSMLLIGTTIVSAQESIRVGVSAGVVLSNVGGDDVGDTSSRTGFRFGALADIPITEKFAFQPFVGFSIQGWKVSESQEVKNNYIVIEAKADYEIFDGFSLQAGPLLGINIYNDFDGSEDIPGFSSTNIGVLGGVQYELPMGLFFNAQYDQGLTDLIENAKIKNRNISLSVGYFF